MELDRHNKTRDDNERVGVLGVLGVCVGVLGVGGLPEDLPLLLSTVSMVKTFSASCVRLLRRVGVLGGVMVSRLVVAVATRETELLLEGDLDQSRLPLSSLSESSKTRFPRRLFDMAIIEIQLHGARETLDGTGGDEW